jgi:hypothetical protein
MKEEATRHLLLFSGGGRGWPLGWREAGCRQRLTRSGLVRREEEESRWVPWQAPSLRENMFPEIRQGRTWAKRADEGRRQPKKEWADAVKKEEGGRWGRGGIGLEWPTGHGPGQGRLVGPTDLWENG